VRLQWRGLEWTPFISYRHLSGNISDGEHGRVIGTISSSGLHRTPTEQAYRRAVTQKTAGLDISYRRNRLKAGLTFVHTRFNGEIVPAAHLRNLYAFRGN